MERDELLDVLEAIQNKNNETFTGSNEAELHTREDIADLFFDSLKKASVKLFAIPVVKARILDDLKNKAKEADAEADRIGAADREGGFEKSGEAAGLEIAIEVVEQYVP